MRWTIMLATVLAGCQEYNVRPRTEPADAVDPDIEVDPGFLTLGPLATGDEAIGTFVVRNLGEAVLEVDSIGLSVGEEAFEVLDTDSFFLEMEEEREIRVRFVPVGEVTFGQVVIASNDPDTPEATVDLEGLGEVPALQISPETYLFPGICDDQVVLELKNVGLSDLTLTDLSYSGSAELSLINAPAMPLTLGPSETRDVTVRFTADGATEALGTLTASSNDPRGERTAEQQVEGSGDRIVETYVVEEDPPVDILFAIDKSGSMSSEARALGNAFASFISEIDNVTDDWQIGVVLRDKGCFQNGIITAQTPNYEQVFKDATRGSIFSGGDLTESLLALTDAALEKTTPGACNEGFVRGNALLHIIAVSDEPEQSGQPWDHWVGRWQARMTDPNLVMVSGVVALGSCGDDPAGYREAVNGTGGLLLDVCNSNWGNYAQDLGNASANSLLTYLLSTDPEVGSIEVSVDGTAYSAGWEYDETRNAVIINAEVPVGAEVEISYVSIGC